ncbi:MAG: ATP-binding cassette domain-containing protein [Campylobacterales bacterium]|nr:ATP-binding cassette domain-containing protein [Campylobacterales bacterium]
MEFDIEISLKKKKLLNSSFTLNDSLAIVGMSGSGKSLTLKAILGMVPKDMESKVNIDSEYQLKNGENLSFIPQNPFTSLNPMGKIKDQFFCEEKKAIELLKAVGLNEEILERFPAQLSGGQLQRAIIAISLDYEPKLLLLDEPTTALDYDSKDKVLQVIKDLHKEYGFKMIFVAHDIPAVSSVCEDLLVLKDGEIIEFGKMDEVLENPKEAYTKELINSGFKDRQWRK